VTLVDVHLFHICAGSNCFSVHASNLHPLLTHHHLFYIDVCCVCTINNCFIYLFYVYGSPLSICCSVNAFVQSKIKWSFFMQKLIQQRSLGAGLAWFFTLACRVRTKTKNIQLDISLQITQARSILYHHTVHM